MVISFIGVALTLMAWLDEQMPWMDRGLAFGVGLIVAAIGLTSLDLEARLKHLAGPDR